MGVVVDLPLQGTGVGRNWMDDLAVRRGDAIEGMCSAANLTPNPFPRGKGNNRLEVRLKVAHFCVVENGQNAQFLPYVVVLGRRGSKRSFVLSKIVFVESGGWAILGGACERRVW